MPLKRPQRRSITTKGLPWPRPHADKEQRRSLPRRALCPLSSGKNLLSTAHTRRWSGRLGDLAPTRRKPAGTSMGSLEMEARRRSFPAWQNPRRNGQGSRTQPRGFQNQDPHGQKDENILDLVVGTNPYLWVWLTLKLILRDKVITVVSNDT